MIDERSALLPPLTPTTPARRKVPEAVDVKQRQGSAASAFFVRHNPYYTGPTPGLDALEAEDTLMRPTSLPRRQVIGNQSLLPESTFDDLLLGGYGDQLTPVTFTLPKPKSGVSPAANASFGAAAEQKALAHNPAFLRAAGRVAEELALEATRGLPEAGPTGVSLGLLLALEDSNRQNRKVAEHKEDEGLKEDDDDATREYRGRRLLRMIGLVPRNEGGMCAAAAGNDDEPPSCDSVNTDYGDGISGGSLRELRLDVLHLSRVSEDPTKGAYTIAQQGKMDFDAFAQTIQQPSDNGSRKEVSSNPGSWVGSGGGSSKVMAGIAPKRVNFSGDVLRVSTSGGFESDMPIRKDLPSSPTYGGTSSPNQDATAEVEMKTESEVQKDEEAAGITIAKQLSEQEVRKAMRSRHWRENLPQDYDAAIDRAEKLYDGVFSCRKSSTSEEEANFDPARPQRADKYPILIQTLAIVGAAVAIRVVGFYYYDIFTGYIDLSEIGMVFTGLFFFQGIVFNGVKSDLADAEKLPNSVVITLERIEDIFMYSARSVAQKRLRLSYAQELLIHFARTWREYLVLKEESTYYHCETILRELILLSAIWDSAGGDGMGGVGGAVSSVRTPMSRAAIISRTSVLPAAQALLMFFVVTATSLMYLVRFKSTVVMVAVMVSVLTVIWFSLRMISAMQNPFNICPPQGIRRYLVGYMATVQIFPLNEYIAKLELRCADQKVREEKLFRYMEDNDMRRRLQEAFKKEVAMEEERKRMAAKKPKGATAGGGGAARSHGDDGDDDEDPDESNAASSMEPVEP